MADSVGGTPPNDGVQRFIVAEFHGGPYDGREMRLNYPPPARVRLPILPPLGVAQRPDTGTYTPPRIASYIFIPTPDGGDVMAVTDEEVHFAKFDLLEYLSRDMARLLYRYEVLRA